MNYQDIITYLQNQNEFHSVDYIKNVLLELELEIDHLKVVIVAGTNGKGTTCATLQYLLTTSGKNVGFFSSPHLEKVNERIKFNCKDISDEAFVEIFNSVHKRIRKFNLSYFEYLTIMAAYYFFEIHKNTIDFAIFEVGLGGSLDSTNAIPHKVSVITRLGIDHRDILGNDLISIAKNKFGIISENNKVFHTKFNNDNIQKLSEIYAQKYQATFIESYRYEVDVETSNRYPKFKIKTQFGDFNLNLQGNRGAENSILAITIFDYLIENSQKFFSCISMVDWPGRMEKVVYKNRDVFLSGDHNPQGIQSLLDIIEYYKFDRVHFVVGICYDKEHTKMLESLMRVKNSVLYLTETSEKTLSINDYPKKFLKSSKYASPDPIKTLEIAILNASKNDLLIVTGSLYLVGKIKTHAKYNS